MARRSERAAPIPQRRRPRRGASPNIIPTIINSLNKKGRARETGRWCRFTRPFSMFGHSNGGRIQRSVPLSAVAADAIAATGTIDDMEMVRPRRCNSRMSERSSGHRPKPSNRDRPTIKRDAAHQAVTKQQS